MGRITIHLHGAPKEKSCGELIDMYGKRLTVKGFKLEIHNSKKSLEQYFADIDDGSNVILLDERGAHYDSVNLQTRSMIGKSIVEIPISQLAQSMVGKRFGNIVKLILYLFQK